MGPRRAPRRIFRIVEEGLQGIVLHSLGCSRDHFSGITTANTARDAWDILQKEFQGDLKVMTMRRQSFRRECETLLMKCGELVQDFLSRISSLSK